MFARCKLLGLLTRYQAELLKTLYDLGETCPDASWRPRELGAFKGSHHPKTLAALESFGYAQRIELPERQGLRPQYAWRITSAGCRAWENFVELSEVHPHAVPGREADRHRARAARALATA